MGITRDVVPASWSSLKLHYDILKQLCVKWRTFLILFLATRTLFYCDMCFMYLYIFFFPSATFFLELFYQTSCPFRLRAFFFSVSILHLICALQRSFFFFLLSLKNVGNTGMFIANSFDFFSFRCDLVKNNRTYL